MIEQFAALYVNVLIPLGQGLLVFFIILTVLWLLIVINDAKKGKELVTGVFNFMFQAIQTIFKFTGVAIWEIIKFILRALHIIFAAVRDFFVSRV